MLQFIMSKEFLSPSVISTKVEVVSDIKLSEYLIKKPLVVQITDVTVDNCLPFMKVL